MQCSISGPLGLRKQATRSVLVGSRRHGLQALFQQRGLTVHGGNRSPAQWGLVSRGRPWGAIMREARAERCKVRGELQTISTAQIKSPTGAIEEERTRRSQHFDTLIAHVLIAGGVKAPAVAFLLF